MNTRGRTLLLLVTVATFGCLRTADEFEDTPPQAELEQLRVDACEAMCSTMDRCQPTRFEDEDPPICFDRCMTLMPRLHEENQCGSRELEWMFCVGELTCKQFIYSFECHAEFELATKCDEDEPFDLDEPSHSP